jgi:hypothetical protein
MFRVLLKAWVIPICSGSPFACYMLRQPCQLKDAYSNQMPNLFSIPLSLAARGC